MYCSCVRSVSTVFGCLRVPKDIDREVLDAELKGLNLLHSILWQLNQDEANVWVMDINPSGRLILRTTDKGPAVEVDPLSTIENRLNWGNEHLVVHLRDPEFHEPQEVCIIRHRLGPHCAVSDDMVSLILLGQSRWPFNETPPTLEMKALAFLSTKPSLQPPLPMSGLDREHFETINTLILLEDWRSALEELGAYARRGFVCKGWTVELTREYLERPLSMIPPGACQRYLRNPTEPTDRNFLEFAPVE